MWELRGQWGPRGVDESEVPIGSPFRREVPRGLELIGWQVLGPSRGMTGRAPRWTGFPGRWQRPLRWRGPRRCRAV